MVSKIVTRHIRLAIFILIVTGALGGVLFVRYIRGTDSQEKHVSDAVLVSQGIRIPVSIADTEPEREQGLSGTASLASYTGKFFIFDVPGNYGFWMKDMQYGLDLVWIDSQFQVVDITHNVSPRTYPTVFYPKTAVTYVLEINQGEAQQLGITEDTKFSLEQ